MLVLGRLELRHWDITLFDIRAGWFVRTGTASALACLLAACSAVEERAVTDSDAKGAIFAAFQDSVEMDGFVLKQEVLRMDHIEGDLWCGEIMSLWSDPDGRPTGPATSGGACWEIGWGDSSDHPLLLVPGENYLARLKSEGMIPDYVRAVELTNPGEN